MPATHITVTHSGTVAGKLLLVPTGEHGPAMAHVQVWVSAQLKAKTPVKDVSTTVLVKGIKQWVAYETQAGGKKVLAVFKIT